MTTEQRDVLIFIDFGRHSKIPDCCIMEYVFNYLSGDFYEVNTKKERVMKGGSWGYVPCWKCLKANHKVKIHHCYKGCGSEKIKSIPKKYLKYYPGHQWMLKKK